MGKGETVGRVTRFVKGKQDVTAVEFVILLIIFAVIAWVFAFTILSNGAT